MSDEDPGDVFLRHRGAVLDALLSDPSFGQPGAPRAAGSASESPESEPDSAPPAGRRGDGPKASERILALLNGQAADVGDAMDFASDYSAAAARATTRAEPEPPPQRPASAGANRLEPARRALREVPGRLRDPKVALAVGAVVAVLLVLLLVTTGGPEHTAQDKVLVVTPPPTSAAATSAAPAASIIQVKSAESKCPPGSTSAMDAFGGQPGKAWSCVRAYKVDGQIMTIDLGKTYQIDSIGIVPGWDHVGADGTDQWAKYRTVSRVSYQFDDANKTVYTQPTLDQRTLVVTKIEPPVSASRIVLSVLESKGEPAVNTVAISSVVVTGR